MLRQRRRACCTGTDRDPGKRAEEFFIFFICMFSCGWSNGMGAVDVLFSSWFVGTERRCFFFVDASACSEVVCGKSQGWFHQEPSVKKNINKNVLIEIWPQIELAPDSTRLQRFWPYFLL